MLQNRDARIETVAIAIECIDCGSQSPRLVLAVLCDRLDLLRLPRQIGRRDLVAPRSDRGLVRHQRHDHGRDGGKTPRAEPPQRASVEFVLLGQKSGQQATGIFGIEAGQIDRILCHTTFPALLGPSESS